MEITIVILTINGDIRHISSHGYKENAFITAGDLAEKYLNPYIIEGNKPTKGDYICRMFDKGITIFIEGPCIVKIFSTTLKFPPYLHLIQERHNEIKALVTGNLIEEALNRCEDGVSWSLPTINVLPPLKEKTIDAEVLGTAMVTARNNKDYKTADSIRKQLVDAGFDVMISKEGTRIKKRS